MSTEPTSNINQEALANLFKILSFTNPSTKITSKTVALSSEYLTMFTREAVLRANQARLAEEFERQEQGLQEDDAEDEGGVLDTQHLENISGVLVLDF